MVKDTKYFTLPNILTLLGLVCGVLAIVFAFEMPYVKLHYASYFVFAALFFDFVDGFAARLTRSSTPLGKQIDSLADLVSFGVAPAVIMFQMMKYLTNITTFAEADLLQILYTSLPVLLVIAAALRLAKFNITETSQAYFKGLPAPASGIYFAAFPLWNVFDPGNMLVMKQWLDIVPFKFELLILGIQLLMPDEMRTYLLAFFGISIVLMSVLQLSNMRIFSFKFIRSNKCTRNTRLVFLVFALLLLVLFQTFIIPFVIIFYILFSIIRNLICKH